MTENATVLVIMPAGKRRSHLTAELKALGANPVVAEDCEGVRRALHGKSPLPLLISDVSFADGDWRDVLAESHNQPLPASFLVSTPYPDNHLWSEVLWRGAYDLLVEPYSASELRRILEGALRSYESQAARPILAAGAV